MEYNELLINSVLNQLTQALLVLVAQQHSYLLLRQYDDDDDVDGVDDVLLTDLQEHHQIDLDHKKHLDTDYRIQYYQYHIVVADKSSQHHRVHQFHREWHRMVHHNHY